MARLAPFPLGLTLAALVLLLDQLSKWLILHVVMDPPRLIALLPFFNLTLVMNRGASFGLLGGAPGWVGAALSFFAVAVAVGLVIWMRFVKSPLLAAAFGLVAGGALGNVIDRLRFGAVVDFLDFHAGTWHWPAFNIADSAITVGVGLLILDSLKSGSARP